jgi:hypothetical protein
MPRVTAAPLLLAAALLSASCQLVRPQPGVHLSSTPPGAEVWVDGAYSGFVTPANIALRTDDWHRVEFVLAGHTRAERLIGPGSRVTVVNWTEGSIGEGVFWFPILLPIESIVPFTYEARSSPQRIHVHLARSAR